MKIIIIIILITICVNDIGKYLVIYIVQLNIYIVKRLSHINYQSQIYEYEKIEKPMRNNCAKRF